jgi:hypothetical protein
MIEGKIVARVIEEDDDPWIVFTDGSGIRLVGWEDGSSYEEVTADEIAKHQVKLAERALAAHRQAAYQESWMMRTCDERAELRAERLAAQPKGKLIPFGFEDAIMDSMVWDMNQIAFGEQPKIKARCPRCNERGCPNAPYMEPPNQGPFHRSAAITIPAQKP